MDKTDRRRVRMWIWGAAALLIMGAIFFFSSQPAGDSSALSDFLLDTKLGQLLMRLLPALSEQGDSHDIRKYAHMFEYMCLGVSVCMFAREALSGKSRRGLLSVCGSWLWCLLYAGSDELHQRFVEGRSCQLSDVGVDSIGFSLGIIITAAAVRIIQIRRTLRKEER